MDTIAHPFDGGDILSPACQVHSHNEWDPLEEVIVGRLDGATLPSNHSVVSANIPSSAAGLQRLVAGFHFPSIMVELAQRELDGSICLLKSRGIMVRQPDAVDYKKRFGTLDWTSR